MQGETRNFLDTYALYEIIKGNENYSCFAGQTVYCSMVNLAELAYALLKQFPKTKLFVCYLCWSQDYRYCQK